MSSAMASKALETVDTRSEVSFKPMLVISAHSEHLGRLKGCLSDP